MTRARRRTLLLVVAVLLAAVSACATGGVPGRVDKAGLDRARAAAREELARWAAATAAAARFPFVPTGPATGQIGTWEPAIAKRAAAALAGGDLYDDWHYGPDAPPTATVRWADGTTRQVGVLTADDAYDQLVRTSPASCAAGCRRLVLTAPVLATLEVATTRGPAQAPVWEFPVTGSAVRITRLAVPTPDRVAVDPRTPDPRLIGTEPPRLAAHVGTDGTRLGLTFTAGGGHADQPCGHDYTAEAVESDTAVVVIVVDHRYQKAADVLCELIGYGRQTSVRLRRPLGDRAVLGVIHGLPIPVSRG